MTEEQRQRLRDLMAESLAKREAVKIPADIVATINEAMQDADAAFRQDILKIRKRERRLRNLPVPYPFRHGAYDD